MQKVRNGDEVIMIIMVVVVIIIIVIIIRVLIMDDVKNDLVIGRKINQSKKLLVTDTQATKPITTVCVNSKEMLPCQGMMMGHKMRSRVRPFQALPCL